MIQTRITKYTTAIIGLLESRGHATNGEILEDLRSKFPDLSATTVHRATSRLSKMKEIGVAPPDSHGSIRYDSNVSPHDHFICSGCGGIRDIDIVDEFMPRISKALGGCKITGRLVINGKCEVCIVNNKERYVK